MKTFFTRILLLSFTLLLLSLSMDAQRLMPNRTLTRYSVSQKGNTVVVKGTLSSSHNYDKIVIERKCNQGGFENIAALPVGTSVEEYSFTYTDVNVPGGDNYYRIRIQNTLNNFEEISNVWMVDLKADTKELALRNSMLQSSNPVLVVTSKNDGEMSLQISDLTGHPVYNGRVVMNQGINSFNIQSLAYAKGFFIVTLQNKDYTVSKQIVVQ